MACCGSTTPSAGVMDRAAICWACPHSRPRRGFCAKGGASIADLTIGGEPCPLGKHDGGAWIGVPWPVRVVIHALGGPHPDEFAGCGCLRAVKSWLERLALPLPEP